jgi:hypothetical protein
MAEDDLRDKLIQILKDNGTREETLCALRTLLIKALEDGEKRETILIKMGGVSKISFGVPVMALNVEKGCQLKRQLEDKRTSPRHRESDVHDPTPTFSSGTLVGL